MQVLGLKPGQAPWGNPSLSNSNKDKRKQGKHEKKEVHDLFFGFLKLHEI